MKARAEKRRGVCSTGSRWSHTRRSLQIAGAYFQIFFENYFKDQEPLLTKHLSDKMNAAFGYRQKEAAEETLPSSARTASIGETCDKELDPKNCVTAMSLIAIYPAHIRCPSDALEHNNNDSG